MRDITSNDFTVMESNSEDFYAFRIDTGPYKDVIFRFGKVSGKDTSCLLYTSPSPRDRQKSRMPSSA